MSTLIDAVPAGMSEVLEESSAEAVPEPIPFENTGEVASAIYEAVQGEEEVPENFVVELGKVLHAHRTAERPAVDLAAQADRSKSDRLHNWITGILAILLGPGGAIAVIYATSDRAKANSAQVEHLKKTTESFEPRLAKTEEDVGLIQTDVGKLNESMGGLKHQFKTQIGDIAKGIKELKQENVNKLTDELEDARRELRRERNRDR